jgi:hypothetical protein
MRRIAIVAALLLLATRGLALAQGPAPSAPPTGNCFIGQQNIARSLETQVGLARCIRDWTRVEIPWVQALSLEGRVFSAAFGTGTTGVSGKTAFTTGSPDANIDVPQGITIIPIYVDMNVVAAAGTVNHFWLQINANLTGNGTSSAGPTPVNLRITDAPFTSRVTTRQAYTVAGTAPTTSMELMHLQNAVAASTSTPWSWTYPQGPIFLPPVTGPASISFYSVATTTAASFQLRVVWVELPSSVVQ